MNSPAVSVPPLVAPAPASSRLRSLDALRGFDMMWIIGGDAVGHALEHFSGGTVSKGLGRQFGHPDWVGFTFYDLIFPLFLFMVGVAITLSLDRLVRTEGRPAAVRRILRRSAIMFALGVLLYGGLAEGLDRLRLLGVLQRIAICYAITGILYLYAKPRTLVVTALALLVGYWALLTFVPVPGVGAGDYARGRNLANWIDQQYLPFRVWYGDYDPEGFLSTLPAIASCILGVMAGLLLRREAVSPSRKAAYLALAGLALLAVGHAWGLQFPIIKRIWTSSYALVAGGWSFLLLALFYWIIDVRGWQRWSQPFVWIGTNAITIYIISNIVDFQNLVSRVLGGEVGEGLDAMWPGLGGITRAAAGIALCFAICAFLYRRKIFLKL